LNLPEYGLAKIWNLIEDHNVVAKLNKRLSARICDAARIKWAGH
jgi:hypothetical protein